MTMGFLDKFKGYSTPEAQAKREAEKKQHAQERLDMRLKRKKQDEEVRSAYDRSVLTGRIIGAKRRGMREGIQKGMGGGGFGSNFVRASKSLEMGMNALGAVFGVEQPKPRKKHRRSGTVTIRVVGAKSSSHRRKRKRQSNPTWTFF